MRRWCRANVLSVTALLADLIAQGVHDAMGEGIRCKQVEIVLDELEATRHAIARSNPGDLIVIGAESYAIQGEPIRDRDRLIWTVELMPA